MWNKMAAWCMIVVMLTALSNFGQCRTRNYFIAAIDIDWDYAPKGNVVKKYDSEYNKFYEPSIDPPRIGHVYKKAVLREFTDATFSHMEERPSWLGFLGPIIRAEINDTIVIQFWNNATGNNFTLHPHGVQYNKDSEGARYNDGTNGKDKLDDGVPPGGQHTYIWNADPRYGPTEGDPLCLTWAYHSHNYAERDINTGVIGAMIICQKGTLSDVTKRRKDVDQEYVLFYHLMDENKSWYNEDNLRKLQTTVSADVLENEDFIETNIKYAINGYAFGNLLGINACVGDKVSWHLFSLGNEADVHGIRFQTLSMTKKNRRTNFAVLFPAKFETLQSTPPFSGNWTISCEVSDHYLRGMQAFFEVENCGKTDELENLPSKPQLREYYVAAQEVEWNYAPSGMNKISNKPLVEDEHSAPFFSRENGHLGGTYLKAIYRQYDDVNFTVTSQRETHLGILGPVISGEVGDVIKIVFFNNASFNHSLILNGPTVPLNQRAIKHLGLDDNPQAYNDHTVQPGDLLTTYWLILTDATPTPHDEDCISSYYSSYTDIRDIYAGLIGFMLYCRKGSLTSSGRQNNVDKEFFLLLSNTNENESPYLDKNIERYSSNSALINKDDLDFTQSNIKYTINGLTFNNLEGLKACLGDRVIWHVLSVGTESDVHVVHFEGLTVTYHDTRRDSVDLVPVISRTFRMKPDLVGDFQVTCMTNTHYDGGMRTHIIIDSCGKSATVSKLGKPASVWVRIYHIGIVEQEWDYAPNNDIHPVFNQPLLDVEQSKVFLERNYTRIGQKYKKALYREFTDETFTAEKCRSKDEQYLGLIGPLIKAEVGDTVKIVFKNMATRNYNIKVHGLTNNTIDSDGIAPNSTHVYEWKIQERSGPEEGDLNCVTWAYTSTVNHVKDVNSGLIGPVVICRKGTLDQSGHRKDVKYDFALLFSVNDENKSWYLDDNIKKYCLSPEDVDKDDEDFQESNKMHGINGYVYGNLEGLVVKENEPATMYLIGLGDEVDIHTVHFHGETFLSRSGEYHRGDVTEVFPGTTETIQLRPANPGTWLLHCHVNDHMEAGMMTTFTVLPADSIVNHSAKGK